VLVSICGYNLIKYVLILSELQCRPSHLLVYPIRNSYNYYIYDYAYNDWRKNIYKESEDCYYDYGCNNCATIIEPALPVEAIIT
jgi:hypothetical protein